jgi:branched-chain amino acid transport system ATP-binding protein
MLHIQGVSAGYGGGRALHTIDLSVAAATVAAVLGRNGAGKTTLLHTVAGLLNPHAGSISIDGRDVTGWPAHRIARAGVRLVAQGRRVFASLTVAEHLTVAHRRNHPGPWTPDRVLTFLPQLAARRTNRGGALSGGEQQLLAIAVALLGQPRLLLLDEPTEGLAPTVAAAIRDLIPDLAATGMTVVVTAPHLPLATAVADHLTLLAGGRVHSAVTGEQARTDPAPLLAALSPGTPPPVTTPAAPPHATAATTRVRPPHPAATPTQTSDHGAT